NYDLPFDAEDYVHRIGRTARLGAEGDAISFACEIYAQSLPDIEAYIEQKLPVEPVTTELLTAIPRAPRAAPEPGDEVDEDAGESIGTIFKEAREQRIADEQRRGGGRTGSSSGGRTGSGPSRPRSGAPSSDGKPRAPRPPPRSPDVAAETPVSVPVAAAASTTPANATDATRPPRKRRRRRNGVPVDGGTATAATPQQPSQAPKVAAASDNSSFLTKLGRKLKSLVSGT
ncbi:MAG: ATP-dependent RNA helicase RhlB, partial [Pseudoxanthomonas sp.]